MKHTMNRILGSFIVIALSASIAQAKDFKLVEETQSPIDSITEVFGDFVDNDLNVYTNSSYTNLNMQFRLLKEADLSCMIYNENGDVVKTVNFGTKPAGIRHIVVQIDGLEPGSYKAKLNAEGLSITEWFEILQ